MDVPLLLLSGCCHPPLSLIQITVANRPHEAVPASSKCASRTLPSPSGEALFLSPTRELAEQSQKVCLALGGSAKTLEVESVFRLLVLGG